MYFFFLCAFHNRHNDVDGDQHNEADDSFRHARFVKIEQWNNNGVAGRSNM